MTTLTRKAYQKIAHEQNIERIKNERLERIKNVTSLIKSQMDPLQLPYHKETEYEYIRNYVNTKFEDKKKE
jgi:hypothetical protein